MGEFMPNDPIPPARLRQLRDLVIRHVYEHGAGKSGWGVPLWQVQKALSISRSELQAVTMVMIEQGLLSKRGSIGDIGLSSEGQDEAARLGGGVPMREQPPSPIVIHANYSVVQVAGANSTQSAQLVVDQSRLTNVLEQIEKEIPNLNLEPGEREEAHGLLTSLRKVISDKLPEAATRAIGAALASVIMTGGSKLGQVLLDVLNISPK
jgi:hypothetical protein